MGFWSYISRDNLKLRMADTATTDDVLYRAVLENVSELIDQYCQRTFRTVLATRIFTAKYSDHIDVEDLLAVTSLKTDEDDNLTYEITWAVNTDYELQPYNAPSDRHPYWRIKTRPNGNYTFPVGHQQGVQIVGKWGYYEDLETSASTAAEALDASETGVDVTAGTDFDVLDTLLIDSEQMYVTAITTNTLTVVRGVNGTTAATHTTASVIQRYRYPGPIVEACGIQAARYFMRKNAPFGVMGTADVGFVRLRGLDMDVKEAIDRYALATFGAPV